MPNNTLLDALPCDTLGLEYRNRVSEIIERESIEVRARTDALTRCEKLEGLEDLQTFLNAAKAELVAADEDKHKHYLFAYFQQIYRVIAHIRNDPLPPGQ